MKHKLTLTITSLLSILFFAFQFGGRRSAFVKGAREILAGPPSRASPVSLRQQTGSYCSVRKKK
jgi:hypothetical protein